MRTDGRTERRTNMKKVTVAFRTSWNTPSDIGHYLNDKPLELVDDKYEGWNFNSGNYLFTTDTK